MASPVLFKIGSVNLATGGIQYADVSWGNITDYILASAAIPIMMPTVEISGQGLIDGGARDSAPIGVAIDDGAERIVTIACHAESLAATSFDPGRASSFVNRIMDIVSNENVTNDIRIAELINQLIESNSRSAAARGKRLIALDLIRPTAYPDIDFMNFKWKEIDNLLNLGRMAAQQNIQNEGLRAAS